MIVDGRELANIILDHLKQDIQKGIESGMDKPRLVVFSVKPSEETLSYMRIKKQAAERIGADFELITYKKVPKFETFVKSISQKAHSKNVHGIIIQEPLPTFLSTITLFDYIPLEKEIEGFKKKSPFDFPIGLATLTAIKKTFSPEDMTDVDNITIDVERDTLFFKNILKRKKIVLIGRGKTGGQPIGHILRKAKISFINLNSKTIQNAGLFTQQADVIISAVGKKVITPESIKDNVALYSVGMRKIGKKWEGDYDKDEIESKALAFTPTPGGIGPLNVAYLMYNLVKAWHLQLDRKKV